MPVQPHRIRCVPAGALWRHGEEARPYYPTKAAWAAAEAAQVRQAMQAADREPARGQRSSQRKALVMARLRARKASLLRLVPQPYDDGWPI